MLNFNLGILVIIRLVALFLFQWYVLTQLGAGFETDALFAGMTVPQLVLAVVSSSLAHVLVPFFSGENEVSMRSYVWTFSVLVCSLLGMVSFLLYVFAPWWVPLSVPGFDEVGKLMTLQLTRIQLLGLLFSGLSAVQIASCNARGHFIRAELTLVVVAIVTSLLLIPGLPSYGVYAAAWLGVARALFTALLLIPSMGYPIRIDLSSPAVIQMWDRIKPLLMGATYYKSEPLIDRILLSYSANGSIALYYLGQNLFSSATQVLGAAILRPRIPVLSKCFKNNSYKKLSFYYRLMLFQILLIVGCSAVIFGFRGGEFLNLFVGHGNINSSSVYELWLIMLCLLGYFLGGALGLISTATLYSLGDTKSSTIIGMYSYTGYIPLKIVLFSYFGVYGLALGCSMFLLVNFFIQKYYLDRRIFQLTMGSAK